MKHIEATTAARHKSPIRYKDQVYSRIIAIGMKYPERGEPIPFVTLLDKSSRSVADVNPRDCEIISSERENSFYSAGAIT